MPESAQASEDEATAVAKAYDFMLYKLDSDSYTRRPRVSTEGGLECPGECDFRQVSLPEYAISNERLLFPLFDINVVIVWRSLLIEGYHAGILGVSTVDLLLHRKV